MYSQIAEKMKNSLQQLLVHGKIVQVIADLKEATNMSSDDQHLVIVLAARYAENERGRHAGPLDHSTYSIELNKINTALLTVMERLPDVRIKLRSRPHHYSSLPSSSKRRRFTIFNGLMITPIFHSV